MLLREHTSCDSLYVMSLNGWSSSMCSKHTNTKVQRTHSVGWDKPCLQGETIVLQSIDKVSNLITDCEQCLCLYDPDDIDLMWLIQ